MKKKNELLLLLTLLLFLPLSSVQVSGSPLLLEGAGSASGSAIHIDARIIDAKTGERLPFASIYISGQNSTISNAEGEFAIDADSADVLRISYVGYKTVHLRAVDVGQEVLLSTEGEMLGEVVVLGTDYIIQKALEVQKKEYKKHKRAKSNFFYRQVGYSDRQCRSFLESFFACKSAFQLMDMSFITGRFVAVASMRTVSPTNFFTFAQIPIFSNSWNISNNEQLVPLHVGYDEEYETDVEIISDGERRLYVVYFIPRDPERWAIECRLYIDAETFQVLKYQGVGNREFVSHMVGNKGRVLPANLSFVINYQHDHGFTEVRSVNFRVSYKVDDHTFDTTGMMFNVADRFVKGHGTLRFEDNLLDIIGRKGLDREFWQKYEIVKRTPIEKEAVELFERDNLFGVF